MEKLFVRSFLPAAILVAIVATANPGYCAGPDLTIQEIVKKVAPSVVRIEIYDKAGDLVSGGTGFVLKPGLILTNAHIVDELYSMSVASLASKKMIDRQPKILKYNRDVDLALLEARGIEAPPLPLDSGLEVSPGQRVVIYGNDYEDQHLVSDGIVRACLPTEIIFSAPTHAGHSGSPLLDMRGRLIGIHGSSMSRSNIDSMSFAINLGAIARFLNSPDSPKSFPVAGTSLFWPRIWKRVTVFFEDVFGWIFDLGGTLFSLWLKAASVLLALLFLWKLVSWAPKVKRALRPSPAEPDSKPVMAYLAFALFLLTLISSGLYGLYIVLSLFDSPPALALVKNICALALISAMCYYTKAYYQQHRPGRNSSEAEEVPIPATQVESGPAAPARSL